MFWLRLIRTQPADVRLGYIQFVVNVVVLKRKVENCAANAEFTECTRSGPAIPEAFRWVV